MLIDFSVENFRSFGAEQTLNMVASGRINDHEDHCVRIGNTRKEVLRAAVIYGANAAGKSNLVRAIDMAQEFVLYGSKWFKRVTLNRFRFCRRKNPTSFEFRFLVDDQIFVYGFTVNAKEVVQEWLTATTSNGKEIDIFGREGQKFKIGNLKPFGADGNRSTSALNALEKLGARPNQLMLSKIVDLDTSHRGRLLDRVVWWFSECLTVIRPESSFGPLLNFLEEDHDFRDFAGQFLRSVGTGIDELQVDQSEIKTERLPKGLLDGLLSDGEEANAIFFSPHVNISLDPDNPAKVIRRNLSARHHVQNADYSIAFSEESDGTQRCLNLLPALYHLADQTKVFVIDELDRSLHPLLSYKFLEFFVDYCRGSCQQLIVTTHETHLLDQDLLRRDEIWFVEKDKKEQTQLYSLADMKIRNDLRIEKGYLQGRFGGIPFIGDTKKLQEMVECSSGS